MYTHNHLENQRQWYAVHVRSRQEKSVELMFRHKGLETFLPLYTAERRWASTRRSVELPLISCYVFTRFDITKRLPVLITPGVLSIVGCGPAPQPVEEVEIAALQTIVASGYPAEPVEYLHCGDRVRVAEGPLAGLEGVLVSHKSRKRLTVSITLLQRSVAVELDTEQVKPVQSQARFGTCKLSGRLSA
jgi:transcription antitermination factor NusG